MTFARDVTQEVPRMRLSDRILRKSQFLLPHRWHQYFSRSLCVCVYMCVVSREANQRGTINFVCFQ